MNIKTAKETEIRHDTAQSFQTEDIVHCGVSCSKEETCSGLQYDRETKVCRKMKNLPCIPSDLLATESEESTEIYWRSAWSTSMSRNCFASSLGGILWLFTGSLWHKGAHNRTFPWMEATYLDARAGSLWHKRAGASNSSDLSWTSSWRTLV